jgi:hypothetical protein
MAKYRVIPHIIEAIEWTGDNLEECKAFTGDKSMHCEPMHGVRYLCFSDQPFTCERRHLLEGKYMLIKGSLPFLPRQWGCASKEDLLKEYELIEE